MAGSLPHPASPTPPSTRRRARVSCAILPLPEAAQILYPSSPLYPTHLPSKEIAIPQNTITPAPICRRRGQIHSFLEKAKGNQEGHIDQPPPTPTPPLQGHRASDRHSRTHPSSLPRDPRGRVPDCRRTCSPSRVVQTVLGMLFLKDLFDITGMEAQEEDPFQTSLGTIPSRWPPVDSPPTGFSATRSLHTSHRQWWIWGHSLLDSPTSL